MASDDRLLAEVAAHLNEWGNVPPEAPGHCWWRARPGLEAAVVRVQVLGTIRRPYLRTYVPGDRHSQNPKEMGGQWFGPLEGPTDG